MLAAAHVSITHAVVCGMLKLSFLVGAPVVIRQDVWRQHHGHVNETSIAGKHLPSMYIYKDVLCAGLRA